METIVEMTDNVLAEAYGQSFVLAALVDQIKAEIARIDETWHVQTPESQLQLCGRKKGLLEVSKIIRSICMKIAEERLKALKKQRPEPGETSPLGAA